MTKPKFSNWIEAQCVLEAGKYMLKQVIGKQRTPIEIMIDEATGYDEENKKQVIIILEDMLDAKKYLWLDTAKLEDLLKKIKELPSKKPDQWPKE